MIFRPVYADDYMGRAFDQRSYNCWHFARDVWRDMTAVDLGDLTPESLGIETLAAAARIAALSPRFRQVVPQIHPCLALAERAGRMPHVGVFMRHHVLSITIQGVRFEAIAEFARGFSGVSFYIPEH